MTRRRDTTAAVVLGLALAAGADLALAQDNHARSPYAGMQARDVKALDAKTVEDLRAGRGMGLALAAELNGYPGPMHVLELADRLRLSPDQRAKVQQLFERMKAEAVPLGHKLLDEERSLDRHFAERTITRDLLAALTRSIGETTGALRQAHLSYHLATIEALTPEQVRQYAVERGYGSKHRHRH
jgi:Spy/CpxP family protein refolding chaperone